MPAFNVRLYGEFISKRIGNTQSNCNPFALFNCDRLYRNQVDPRYLMFKHRPPLHGTAGLQSQVQRGDGDGKKQRRREETLGEEAPVPGERLKRH